MSREFSAQFNTLHKPKMWIVRHGETEWSKSGQYTGLTDIPLTQRGERQAREAHGKVEGINFGLVLCSPLQRAVRTAELMRVKNVQLEPNAVEWNYGDYEGVKSSDIRAENPDYLIWKDGVPNGETLEQVSNRADKIIDRVLEENHENALVVCHGHFSRILAARWLGMDPDQGRHFLMETAHVSILGWDKRTPAVEKWNR